MGRGQRVDVVNLHGCAGARTPGERNDGAGVRVVQRALNGGFVGAPTAVAEGDGGEVPPQNVRSRIALVLAAFDSAVVGPCLAESGARVVIAVHPFCGRLQAVECAGRVRGVDR